MNYRNTPIDFNPSRTTNATISAAGLTFPNGTVIAPDAEGCINLDYSATLFINTSGNIRVTTLNDSPGIANSTIFKGVVGDFHRIIKSIWIDGTTITEIVIDERQYIKKN